ncbi:hypothetical protein ACFRQM_09455 [Streptomyces sp. NPDC056831]
MIYLDLVAGLAGLFLALYGRHHRVRAVGGVAAGAALLVAMLSPGAW